MFKKFFRNSRIQKIIKKNSIEINLRIMNCLKKFLEIQEFKNAVNIMSMLLRKKQKIFA